MERALLTVTAAFIIGGLLCLGIDQFWFKKDRRDWGA